MHHRRDEGALAERPGRQRLQAKAYIAFDAPQPAAPTKRLGSIASCLGRQQPPIFELFDLRLEELAAPL